MADIEAPFALQRESIPVKYAAREIRMGFVRKVYGILSLQLLVTVAIAAPIQQMPPRFFIDHAWILLLSLVGSVAAVMVLSYCPDVSRTFPVNYLFLFGFTVFEAVLVGVISARCSSGALIFATLATAIIFFGMTAYAWTTKTDFTGTGPYLFAALLALFSMGCLNCLLAVFDMHLPGMNMVYCGFGILIFTFYIVFDTQLIIGGGHQKQFGVDDYVSAALNLYVDIVDLFLNLLSAANDN